jgi:hypothetical protein
MFIIVSKRTLKLLTGDFGSAMALWPFIIVRDESLKQDSVLINHERIHLRQQLELLLIFFYMWYGIEYAFYRLKRFNARTSYAMVRFEKEAYRFEKDLNYLKRRKWFAFIRG